jgi:hypothetical protein
MSDLIPEDAALCETLERLFAIYRELGPVTRSQRDFIHAATSRICELSTQVAELRKHADALASALAEARVGWVTEFDETLINYTAFNDGRD